MSIAVYHPKNLLEIVLHPSGELDILVHYTTTFDKSGKRYFSAKAWDTDLHGYYGYERI